MSTVEVPLVNGRGVAVVDAADVELVSGYRWYLVKGYAYGFIPGPGRGHKPVLMHRLITEAPAGKDVDHINHDKLDNRRSNLRVCSRQANAINRRDAQSNSRTGVLNVDIHKGRYRVQLRVNGRLKFIGRFDTLDAAIAARDKSRQARQEAIQ
jgi:hypothetical protein